MSRINEIGKEIKELATKQREVIDNAIKYDRFNIYDKKIKSKLDKIAWNIYWLQEERKRLQEG